MSYKGAFSDIAMSQYTTLIYYTVYYTMYHKRLQILSQLLLTSLCQIRNEVLQICNSSPTTEPHNERGPVPQVTSWRTVDYAVQYTLDYGLSKKSLWLFKKHWMQVTLVQVINTQPSFLSVVFHFYY